MDISSLLSTILSNESVAGVAAQVGVNEKDVKNVLSSALPMLLNGANAQSIDESTAESFANALAEHAQSDTTDITAFLQNVDIKDGAKIISHLLGSAEQNQTADVARIAGISTSDTGSVLAGVAPLLMSLLGKQTASEGNSGASVSSLMGSLLGGNDLSGLIGGLLGAGGDKDEKKNGLGILGMLFGKR